MTAGALGGAILIHADGVDFTSTGPLWFAVTLFVALPLAAGAGRWPSSPTPWRPPGSWTARGRVRWVLPTSCCWCWSPGCSSSWALSAWWSRSCWCCGDPADAAALLAGGTLGVRSAFLAVPVLSVVALGQDLAELF